MSVAPIRTNGINNAGLALFGPLQLIDDHEFEQLMQVNLFGVRNAINTFLPLLGRGRDAGRIINISSLSGVFNTPMNGALLRFQACAGEPRRGLPARAVPIRHRRGFDQARPHPVEDLGKNLRAVEPYLDGDYASMAGRVGRIMRGAQRNAQSPRVIAKLVSGIIDGKKMALPTWSTA